MKRVNQNRCKIISGIYTLLYLSTIFTGCTKKDSFKDVVELTPSIKILRLQLIVQ